jgi:hypothetical protein
MDVSWSGFETGAQRNPMTVNKNSRWVWRSALRGAALVLIVAATFVARNHGLSRARNTPAPRAPFSNSIRPAPSPAPYQVKNYFLDFDGDHSLDAATVTEQPVAGYANYTVQLRLASGAQQSVHIAAPPGGLQIEMHDMTGDHVPNDVILRPALLSWPPTVLVNDGHDHFAVVVSGANPGSFSSRENLDSRRRENQSFVFLRSSGFKAIRIPPSARMLAPQLRQSRLSTLARVFAWGTEHASSSGRAPPFFTTI